MENTNQEITKTAKVRKKLSASTLLFKNTIRNTWRSKAQLIGLILLVFLTATVFTVVSISSTRIQEGYQTLNTKSNLHDGLVDFYNTGYKKKSADSNDTTPVEDEIVRQQSLEEVNKYLSNEYNVDSAFSFNRIEGRTFSLENNTKLLKVMGTSDHQLIDKLIINKGNKLTDQDTMGAVINAEFAGNNDISIGDIIRLQKDDLGQHILVNKDVAAIKDYQNQDISDWLPNSKYSNYQWYQVRGFGVSADYSTPIIDQTTPLPDKVREGLVYVNASNFGLEYATKYYKNGWYYDQKADKTSIFSDNDREVYYGIEVNQSLNKKTVFQEINQILKDSSNYPLSEYYFFNSKDNSQPIAFDKNYKGYRFHNRIAFLPLAIHAYRYLSYVLLGITLSISIVSLILVMRKKVENSRIQLGILKGLGYSNHQLTVPFFAYPLVIALIGGTLGFILGIGAQNFPVGIFSKYFNVDFGGFAFDIGSWIYSFIGTFSLLSIVTFIVVGVMLSNSVLNLINNVTKFKDTHFKRFIRKVSSKRKFTTRLKHSFFTESLGKASAVGTTMLLGTILMTTSVMGPKIMSDNKQYAYLGMNYKSSVEYNSPVWNLPTTFYQTYNPNSSSWEPKLIPKGKEPKSQGIWSWLPKSDDDKYNYRAGIEDIIKEIQEKNINQEYYAPNTGYITGDYGVDISDPTGNTLANLNWRNMSKKFLEHLAGKNVSAPVPQIEQILIALAWPDYWTNLLLKVDKEPDKSALEGQGSPWYFDGSCYQNDGWDIAKYYGDGGAGTKFLSNDYDTFRNFYKRYSSTISMNVNPAYLTDESNSQKPNIDKSEINWEALGLPDGQDKYKFNIVNHRLPNDVHNAIINNPASKIATDDTKISYLTKIYEWFLMTFWNRSGDATLQGTYSRAPYFVRQNMKEAYGDKNRAFNITFNVEPVDPKTDYLGTRLDANYKNNPFSILGLTPAQDFMKLTSRNKNINDKLFDNNNINEPNIIINQSLAQKYNLHIGEVFSPTVDQNDMFDATDKANISPFNLDKYGALNNQSSQFGNQSYLASNITYNSSDPLYAENPFNPDASTMEKKVAKGEFYLKNKKTTPKFKIVGIHDGYGSPTAYISNSVANHLQKYDETQGKLWQIFQGDWTNNYDPDKDSWSQDTKDLISYITNQDHTYASTLASSKPIAQKALELFNNQFPVFNYKLSKSANLYDVTNGFSTSSLYGDFTVAGLNGETFPPDGPNSVRYYPHSLGSTNLITPLEASKALLNQLTALVDTVLAIFAIISLVTSFIIIMLSTNLIVSENRQSIAGMQVLGYSNRSITRIITGMYIPIVIFAFIIAFPIGYFGVSWILSLLATNTVWVLPLYFVWWLPVVVGIITFGIYLFTFLLSWYDLRKVKPIEVLKVMD